MTIKSASIRTAQVTALFFIAFALSVPLSSSAVGAPGDPLARKNAVARADRDRDGALTRAEACAGKTPRICKRFQQIDRNQDGVVTRAEIRAYQQAKRVTRPPVAGGPSR